jgi:hypothetical protein
METPAMTNEQKAWLDRNPGFRAHNDRTPGGFQWTQVAFLTPDGTTRSQPKVATDEPIPEGSFKVGVLTERRVGVSHANGR